MGSSMECLIETEEHGIITRWSADAERMFGYSAAETVGKMKYALFHDAKELEACRDSAEFKRAIDQQGFTEDCWKVIPRSGETFIARVKLTALRGEDGKIVGWSAKYERLEKSK